MNRNHVNGRSVWEEWILDYFNYILPNDFQKPSKAIYNWHYAIIMTLIIYALITVIDVYAFKFASINSILLWLLSSGTVLVTVGYNMCRSEDKIWKELLKEPQVKNRAKYINKNKKKEIIDKKFQRKIYLKALNMEKIGLIVGIIFIVAAWIYPVQGTKILFKIAMGILAFLNCFILTVQNAAEFYNAQDYI